MYDCDFDQMLDLETEEKASPIFDYDADDLKNRRIASGSHCFGCTASVDPAMTISDLIHIEISVRGAFLKIFAQIIGTFAGVAAADVMFGLVVFFAISKSKNRRSAVVQRIRRGLK